MVKNVDQRQRTVPCLLMKKMFALLLCCLLMTSLCACETEQLKEDFRIPTEQIGYIAKESTLPALLTEPSERSQKTYDLIEECSVFHTKVQLTTERQSKEHMLMMWQKLDEENQFMNDLKPEQIIHYTQEHKILFCYYAMSTYESEQPVLTEDFWYVVMVDDRSGALLFADLIATDNYRALLESGNAK